MKMIKSQNDKSFSLLLRFLMFLLVFLTYSIAGYPFMRLLGQWPAPYWLSVFIGVFLLHALAGKNFRELIWITPTSLLGYLIVWFVNIGIYKTPLIKWISQHAKWFYKCEWPDKIPVVVFMVVVLFLLSEGKNRFWMSVIFAEFLFVLTMFGNTLVGFWLPIEGACGIDGFNYDVYGFRLGGNFLVAITVSYLSAKYVVKFVANVFRTRDLNRYPA